MHSKFNITQSEREKAQRQDRDGARDGATSMNGDANETAKYLRLARRLLHSEKLYCKIL